MKMMMRMMKVMLMAMVVGDQGLLPYCAGCRKAPHIAHLMPVCVLRVTIAQPMRMLGAVNPAVGRTSHHL